MRKTNQFFDIVPFLLKLAHILHIITLTRSMQSVVGDDFFRKLCRKCSFFLYNFSFCDRITLDACRFRNGLFLIYIYVEDIAMKMILKTKMFLGVGAVIALLGLNVAFADVQSNISSPLMFSLDIGDGIEMSPISFCLAGGAADDEAQLTCMMTPGGPSTIVWDLPPLNPVIDPLIATPQMTFAAFDPISSPAPPPGMPWLPLPPPGATIPEDRPPSDTPVIPAPATVLIVGLGLVALVMTKRRRVTLSR